MTTIQNIDEMHIEAEEPPKFQRAFHCIQYMKVKYSH